MGPNATTAINMSNVQLSLITRSRRQRGVTLIELMIVVAIIAILSAIAIPGYQSYVTESRRSTAQGQMVQLKAVLERFFSDNNDYALIVLNDTTGNFPDHLPIDSANHAARHYDLAITERDGTPFDPGNVVANDYLITATPPASSPQNGDGTMTLDSVGTKTHAGNNHW